MLAQEAQRQARQLATFAQPDVQGGPLIVDGDVHVAVETGGVEHRIHHGCRVDHVHRQRITGLVGDASPGDVEFDVMHAAHRALGCQRVAGDHFGRLRAGLRRRRRIARDQLKMRC